MEKVKMKCVEELANIYSLCDPLDGGRVAFSSIMDQLTTSIN